MQLLNWFMSIRWARWPTGQYVVVWKVDPKPCITSLENSCNRWSFILAKRLNYTIDESMKNTFLCWNWNCFSPGDIEVLQNWENEKESLYSILVKYGVYLERKQIKPTDNNEKLSTVCNRLLIVMLIFLCQWPTFWVGGQIPSDRRNCVKVLGKIERVRWNQRCLYNYKWYFLL